MLVYIVTWKLKIAERLPKFAVSDNASNMKKGEKSSFIETEKSKFIEPEKSEFISQVWAAPTTVLNHPPEIKKVPNDLKIDSIS